MEWMEYEKLEPFGAWRDNYHAAMVATILANAHRDAQKHPEPFGMQEFFYRDAETAAEEAQKAQDKKDQELIAWLDAKAINGESK